nr:PREDICTED: protein arginine N-methyltransferase 2 isoform X1 [Lepisosteus oculatus]
MEEVDEDLKKCQPVEDFVGVADFCATEDNQLSFTTGDRLRVHDRTSPEWWWAELYGLFGYVPSSYVRPCIDEEDVDDAWQDEEYFGSYGSLKLHLEMLSDKPRTETYREVVLSNRHCLEGRVVMDLGCGTGIISLFCARLAEPAAVYAVEASPMADQTRELVTRNGCQSVVSVFKGRVEELALPGKVDVLVSEWMGNCLLFEFMVESVLLARDRWLKEGGMMWPSSAALSLVPCQAEEEYRRKIVFWEKPYGLDFSCLKSLAQKEFFSKPKFSHEMKPEDCLSAPCDVLTLDMHSLQIPDLEKLKGEFCFRVEKSGTFHGFAAWFSVQFQSLDEVGPTLELNTGPHHPLTHWKQTLLMLDSPVFLHQGDSLSGMILLHRNPVWRRHMTLSLHWTIRSTQDSEACKTGQKSFPMWR